MECRSHKGNAYALHPLHLVDEIVQYGINLPISVLADDQTQKADQLPGNASLENLVKDRQLFLLKHPGMIHQLSEIGILAKELLKRAHLA